jgi:hypothetical protein
MLRMPSFFVEGQALAASSAEQNVFRHYLRARHPIKVTFGASDSFPGTLEFAYRFLGWHGGTSY